MLQIDRAALLLIAVTAAAQTDLTKSPGAKVRAIPLQSVHLEEGFWTARREINLQVSIPTLLQEFENRGILDNFRRL